MFLRLILLLPLLRLVLLLDEEETDRWENALDDYPANDEKGDVSHVTKALRQAAIDAAHALPLSRRETHKVRPSYRRWWQPNATIRVWKLDGLTWLDADGKLYYQAGHLFHGVYLEPEDLERLTRHRAKEIQTALNRYAAAHA